MLMEFLSGMGIIKSKNWRKVGNERWNLLMPITIGSDANVHGNFIEFMQHVAASGNSLLDLGMQSVQNLKCTPQGLFSYWFKLKEVAHMKAWGTDRKLGTPTIFLSDENKKQLQ